MAKHKMNHRAGVCLFGLLLITALSQTWAQTPEAAAVTPAEPEPIQQFQVWIQDPWSGATRLATVNEPSTELWNATRIDDYAESIKVEAAPPLAVLTIRDLDIQVPVYNGTDEFNLNRGLGRIRGMARLNEDGNLGISGHRDGFFRGLKDIETGDKIMLRTTSGMDIYAVSDITIVDKNDFSPLEDTTEKTLTLVTCYPFYFVGHAPKRYIVTATPWSAASTELVEEPADEPAEAPAAEPAEEQDPVSS